jgi:WhiB family transcriptional regulator, redox-sensing transcriptional regulator
MVLRLRVEAPGGWEKAKCRGQVRGVPGETDVYDPFFPEEDGHHDVHAEQDAVDFCNGTVDLRQCPIRDSCLIFALTNNERFGVWGGMTELGRKAERKKWPWKGGKNPRPEWHWMTTDRAMSLVSPEELSEEDSDDDQDA